MSLSFALAIVVPRSLHKNMEMEVHMMLGDSFDIASSAGLR